MMKIAYWLPVFCFIFIGNILFTQEISGGSTISGNPIQEKFLEHLIKSKIDSVRSSLNLNPLYNDSILYVASKHHSNYMVTNRKLTHNENGTPNLKTPQDRVNSFGGKNYLAGENVIKSFYNRPMKDKKGNEYINYTYNDLANDLVKGWINSPGHYANIINPEYEITGLSLSVNYEKKQVYATQKFAKVNFKYVHPENKEMFSYSNLEPQQVISGFDNIPNKLIKKKFAWKLKPLREKDSTLCDNCNEAVNNSIYKTQLIFKGRNVYIRSHDAPMITKMIKKWRDGLALEFVEYESYDCGNPEYYTEPSRRNGQSIFNGKVSKPIYRRHLRKGYKKVDRKSKNRKYRWFNNMGLKGNPEFFYIKLGKIPKDMNGYVEVNVVVIKNKRVCRIMHLTDWCGIDYENYNSYPYKDTLLTEKYTVVPYRDSVQFQIDFEQGKSEYSIEDIEPIIKTVTSSKFTVLDAKIKAFSSVEGTESINYRLQQERANSIINAVTQNQTTYFKKDIKVAENWELFYYQIDTFERLKPLRGKSKEELKQIVNNTENRDEYEKYLKKQRYASIDLKIEYDIDDTLQFLLNEVRLNFESIRKYQKKYNSMNFVAYDSILRIQYKLYKYAKAGKASINHLTMIDNRFPYKPEFRKIHEDYFWYMVDLKDSVFWSEQGHSYLSRLYKIGVKEKYVTYNLLNFEMEIYKRKRSISDRKIATLNSMIYGFPSLTNDTFFLNNVELMKEDFLVKTTQNYHFDAPNFDESKMRNYLQMLSTFAQQKQFEHSKMYEFAEFMVFCKQEDIAYNFLLSYLYQDTSNIHHPSLILFSKLSYKHPKEYPFYDYEKFIVDVSRFLTKEEWCSMFVGPCNISFQTMDDESFRDFYCKQCEDYRNYAERPEDWDELK